MLARFRKPTQSVYRLDDTADLRRTRFTSGATGHGMVVSIDNVYSY